MEEVLASKLHEAASICMTESRTWTRASMSSWLREAHQSLNLAHDRFEARTVHLTCLITSS
jgi:hypothetical protein